MTISNLLLYSVLVVSLLTAELGKCQEQGKNPKKLSDQCVESAMNEAQAFIDLIDVNFSSWQDQLAIFMKNSQGFPACLDFMSSLQRDVTPQCKLAAQQITDHMNSFYWNGNKSDHEEFMAKLRILGDKLNEECKENPNSSETLQPTNESAHDQESKTSSTNRTDTLSPGSIESTDQSDIDTDISKMQSMLSLLVDNLTSINESTDDSLTDSVYDINEEKTSDGLIGKPERVREKEGTGGVGGMVSVTSEVGEEEWSAGFVDEDSSRTTGYRTEAEFTITYPEGYEIPENSLNQASSQTTGYRTEAEFTITYPENDKIPENSLDEASSQTTGSRTDSEFTITRP